MERLAMDGPEVGKIGENLCENMWIKDGRK